MIATIKNRIGIISGTNSNTNGNVTIVATKNKNPDKILIFIEIKAKNDKSKQTMKYTIIAHTPFCSHITNWIVFNPLFANIC